MKYWQSRWQYYLLLGALAILLFEITAFSNTSIQQLDLSTLLWQSSLHSARVFRIWVSALYQRQLGRNSCCIYNSCWTCKRQAKTYVKGKARTSQQVRNRLTASFLFHPKANKEMNPGFHCVCKRIETQINRTAALWSAVRQRLIRIVLGAPFLLRLDRFLKPQSSKGCLGISNNWWAARGWLGFAGLEAFPSGK